MLGLTRAFRFFFGLVSCKAIQFFLGFASFLILEMKYRDFSSNSLKGAIPSSLGRLKRLRYL